MNICYICYTSIFFDYLILYTLHNKKWNVIIRNGMEDYKISLEEGVTQLDLR